MTGNEKRGGGGKPPPDTARQSGEPTSGLDARSPVAMRLSATCPVSEGMQSLSLANPDPDPIRMGAGKGLSALQGKSGVADASLLAVFYPKFENDSGSLQMVREGPVDA